MISSVKKERALSLLKDPRFVLGALYVLVVCFCAVMAAYLAPYPLGDTDITQRLCPPNHIHLLGCDLDGGDILTTMLYGARSSLYVSALTVLLSVTVGVLIGLVSGYFGKTIDHIFMRAVDIVMAFPGILLAMSLAALLGPSLHTVIFSISATGWASAARIIRSQVLSLREREYVMASRALGATHTRLIFSHILPGTLTPLVVHSTFALSGVIIVEASLSFLGLGAQDGALTWGGLLGQGSQIELSRAPHLTLIPGAAIFLLVLSLNQMGDALRDALNPRS